MDITDPHRSLGLHHEGRLLRLYAPYETEVKVEVKGKEIFAKDVGDGIFEVSLDSPIGFKDYLVTHPCGLKAHDPYVFLPTFTDGDRWHFNEGSHWKIYEAMGGRVTTQQGVEGVKFNVWAPCARKVFLIGDFNNWNYVRNPMRCLGGVWEIFIPGLWEGALYKFGIETREGHFLLKADPYAFQGEMRPSTASVVTKIDHHVWQDSSWMSQRKKCLKAPINIYEVHLGSWRKGSQEFMNYRDIAPQLADYVQQMGYTHVELMPVMGHQLDESWGYQVTGFYAICKRHGSVTDFQFFVDYLHQRGIGVILDWVPGHFPSDPHALARFDGTCLYEHEDPRQGYHPHWNTHIFNYGRHEVANFLIGSALYYFDKMHIDGLRVDAVSSMVYLDFGRDHGEWIPNYYGGRENLEAIAFLRLLNRKVHEFFPTALMIAEESHAFPGVTHSEGLRFDLRWDLGWMHDILDFFCIDPLFRNYHYYSLIHEMSYFYAENHLLPLSHDEVVHGKKSLLSKMPGTEWERFANLRLLLSYMVCHPGKKLLFMGAEIGQWHEWYCKEELHWGLLAFPYHYQLQNCIKALNHFYRAHPALFADDYSRDGFEWIIGDDSFNCVIVYLRKTATERLLCVHHFTPVPLHHYFIPMKHVYEAKEIFTTDLKEYGGSGIINHEIKIEWEGIRISIPPLATLIIKL